MQSSGVVFQSKKRNRCERNERKLDRIRGLAQDAKYNLRQGSIFRALGDLAAIIEEATY